MQNPIVLAAVTEDTAVAPLCYAILQRDLGKFDSPNKREYSQLVAARKHIPATFLVNENRLAKTHEILRIGGLG